MCKGVKNNGCIINISNVIIYMNKIILHFYNIISYIIERLSSYLNNFEKEINLNILCNNCNKNIKSTQIVYCIYDKTFCTIDCRAFYVKKKNNNNLNLVMCFL
jgi:hypothetical protein